MKDVPKSVHAFGVEHAKRYDELSDLGLMGDRAQHRWYLHDLLRWLPDEPDMFVELGCGTGFFTEVFFEVYPRIRGIAIDGSEAMLDEAKARLGAAGHDLEFRCELLQGFDWSSVGKVPLVFSGLVFHHLSDEERRDLLNEVFEHLEPGGAFILFDSFRPEDATADEIVELLTGLQIQRQVRAVRGHAPSVEEIVARDREAKGAEGDREASIEAHIELLRTIGFRSVVSVFQELRFAGVVALKPR